VWPSLVWAKSARRPRVPCAGSGHAAAPAAGPVCTQRLYRNPLWIQSEVCTSRRIRNHVHRKSSFFPLELVAFHKSCGLHSFTFHRKLCLTLCRCPYV